MTLIHQRQKPTIIYFNKKDSDKNKSTLSLIHSIDIPMKAIKWQHTYQKALCMLLGRVLVTISLYFIHTYLIPLNIRLMLEYVSFVIVIYLISLGYQMLKFKKKDISITKKGGVSHLTSPFVMSVKTSLNLHRCSR